MPVFPDLSGAAGRNRSRPVKDAGRAAASQARSPDPDDAALTQAGLAAPRRPGGTILLIACGALAREILAIREANGWRHLDLTCLPAILHNRPEKIPAAVEAAILAHRDAYSEMFVVYADCGTGGRLRAVCDRYGIAMVPGPHCYAFYEGLDRFAAHADEIAAFYLTDFLVRQFDAFVWKPLGLDRHPELRDAYFGHYRTLVHLAQTDDPDLDARARDCARRLGLCHERRLTGYGDLATSLASLAGPGGG